jgi:hypothetical protein
MCKQTTGKPRHLAMNKIVQIWPVGEKVPDQKVLWGFIPRPTEPGQGLDINLGQIKRIMNPFEIDTPCEAGIWKRSPGLVHASLEECSEQEHRSVFVHDAALRVKLIAEQICPGVAVKLLEGRSGPMASCESTIE